MRSSSLRSKKKKNVCHGWKKLPKTCTRVGILLFQRSVTGVLQRSPVPKVRYPEVKYSKANYGLVFSKNKFIQCRYIICVTAVSHEKTKCFIISCFLLLPRLYQHWPLHHDLFLIESFCVGKNMSFLIIWQHEFVCSVNKGFRYEK